MRLVIARCSVTYEGRLTAYLPMAVRLLMVKADGCVAVHADGGAYKPLNWMNAPNHLEELDGKWIVTNVKGERLEIDIEEILHEFDQTMGLDPGLQKDGVEAHLQVLLAERPEQIEPGLALVRREYPTDIGPVDLLCHGADGATVAVEIKQFPRLVLSRDQLPVADSDCAIVLVVEIDEVMFDGVVCRERRRQGRAGQGDRSFAVPLGRKVIASRQVEDGWNDVDAGLRTELVDPEPLDPPVLPPFELLMALQDGPQAGRNSRVGTRIRAVELGRGMGLVEDPEALIQDTPTVGPSAELDHLRPGHPLPSAHGFGESFHPARIRTPSDEPGQGREFQAQAHQNLGRWRYRSTVASALTLLRVNHGALCLPH